MDNATHSLAGLLLAHGAVHLKARGGTTPSRAFVITALVTSVVGNNFPDLDFVYAGITEGKLGYLLHHRGHTHTVLGAVFTAALMLGVTLLFLRRFRSRTEPAELRWIWGICAIAPLLHVSMDFLNSYGVHPFWPLDNRWYYGDAVFIIEPWLWVIAVPGLVLASRSWVMRVLLGLVLLTGLVLAWTVSFVPWGVALALSVGAVASSALSVRLRPGARIAFAGTGFIAIILVFASASRVAFARVSAAGGSLVVDAILTPAPANPFCFSALVVEAERDVYRLRRATVASLPSVVPVDFCRVEGWEANLPMTAETKVESGGVRWVSKWEAPLQELHHLNETHCQASAFLRFARAPYWFHSYLSPGSGVANVSLLRVGDLRYDRGEDIGFAELSLPAKPTECPRFVPNWKRPRQDLLRK